LQRGSEEVLKKERLPTHVAIIMDGNGRWAKERGLPKIRGHIAGVEAVRRVVKASIEIGIKALTLYTFSTENWSRPRREVNALMRLLTKTIREEIDELNREGVRLVGIGRLEGLPQETREELARAMEMTSSNDTLILNLAVNYGGRAEIIDAVKALILDIERGLLEREKIDEKVFSQYLYTKDLPYPDLLIRTSGEMRVSNFLLYQIAYTEIWITPVYWPDFQKTHLIEALLDYQKRQRRFGG
jgi:undecaprenyl diphosphate synthase